LRSLGFPNGPKQVIITGARSGICAALAWVYSSPGRRLSLIARDRAPLEAVAAKGRAGDAEVDLYVADVTDTTAIELAPVTCDQVQPVDLLVASAGIGGRDALVAPNVCESGDMARQILTTNKLGTINAVAPLLPRLVARGRGQVAIMSSLAGVVALPARPVYSASKYGAALRSLVAASGVRVSVVCPGFVEPQ
jgi:short-subunit dehydrogenase